jgi:hypothetical protein
MLSMMRHESLADSQWADDGSRAPASDGVVSVISPLEPVLTAAQPVVTRRSASSGSGLVVNPVLPDDGGVVPVGGAVGGGAGEPILRAVPAASLVAASREPAVPVRVPAWFPLATAGSCGVPRKWLWGALLLLLLFMLASSRRG